MQYGEIYYPDNYNILINKKLLILLMIQIIIQFIKARFLNLLKISQNLLLKLKNQLLI